MTSQRPMRCPSCGRLLGKAVTPPGHATCEGAFEIKCGRCSELVVLSLDPDIHPYIRHSN